MTEEVIGEHMNEEVPQIKSEAIEAQMDVQILIDTYRQTIGNQAIRIVELETMVRTEMAMRERPPEVGKKKGPGKPPPKGKKRS